MHPRTYQFVFSLNSQTDIRTPVANAALKYVRPIRTFVPLVQQFPAVVSDRAWYGKGHSHPTFRDVVQKNIVVGAQERSATNLEAAFALYYVMGNSTYSPGTGGEHTHVFTWQDLTVNDEALYTTFLEIMGSEYTKRLTGAWINSVTFTGNRNDHVVMSFEGGGRSYEDSTLPAPSSVSKASFFKTLYGKVWAGLGGGTIAEISCNVLSWTITISQNVVPVFRMCNPSGEEMLVSKVNIGDQTVSGNVVIGIDASYREAFLDQEDVELEIICRSPDLISTNPHSLTFHIPVTKLSTEAFGEDEQEVTYTLTFDEDSVLKGSGEHLEVTLVSDIDNSELGVVSQAP